MAALHLGLVNDLHYGWPADRDMTDYLRPRLEEVVDRFNDRGVDAVVALGDLIEHAPTADGDRERLETLKNILARVDADLYAVPGNHDVTHLPPEDVVAALGADNEEPYTTIDHDLARLVLLDTTHQDQDLHPVGGVVGIRQRDWLDQQLDTKKPVVVLTHHALHHREMPPESFFASRPELAVPYDKELVHDLFTAAGTVSLVVNAHLHKPGYVEQDSIPHVTCGAMNKVDETPGVQEGGVAELIISEGGIAFQSAQQKVEISL